MDIIKWIKHKFANKLSHVTPSKLKKILKEHGISLVVIIVGWELIEDTLSIMLFVWLGNNFNPIFYAGVPVAWLFCIHSIMVPVLWGTWIKIKKMGMVPFIGK